MRRSRSGATIDSRRPSLPSQHVRRGRPRSAYCGRVLDEPREPRRRTPAAARACPAPSVVVAHSGSSPTIERTRSGTRSAVGQVQHVVVEAVLLVPQALVVHGLRRCRRSARRTWWRGPRTSGRARPAPATSRAGSGSTWPSTRCRRTARGGPSTGSCGRAVDRADVVEPEEAALEHVVALGVLAVDPPREVEQQLVEDPLEEVEVRRRRRSRTPAAPPRRARAG